MKKTGKKMASVNRQFQLLHAESTSRCDSFDARLSTLEAYIMSSLNSGANRLESQYRKIVDFVGAEADAHKMIPELDRLKTEIQAIRNRKAKCEMQLKVNKQNNHGESVSLLSELKEARTQKITAQFKVEKQTLEIESLRKALASANETIHHLESNALDREEGRVARLRQQLKEALQKAMDAEDRLNELSDALDESALLKMRIKELESEMHKPTITSMESSGAYNTQSIDGENIGGDTAKHLRSKAATLDLKRQKAIAETERANALLVEKMSQIATLQTSKQMIKDDLSKAQQRLLAAEGKYKDYTSHLREKIISLENQIIVFQKAQGTKDEEIATSELKIMGLETELSIAKNAVGSTQQQLLSLQKNQEEKSEAFATKYQSLEDAFKEKNDALNQSNALVSMMQEQMEVSAESLNKSQQQTKATNAAFLSLQAEARQKEKDMAQQVKALQLDISDLRSKLEKSYEQVAKRDETISSLEWKLDTIRSEMQQAHAKMSSSESHWVMIERVMTKESSILKDQLQEAVKKEAFLEKTRTTNEQTITLLTENIEKCRSEKEHLEINITELQKSREETVAGLMADNGKLEWSLALSREANEKSMKIIAERDAELSVATKNAKKWEHSFNKVMEEKDAAFQKSLEKESDLNEKIASMKARTRAHLDSEEQIQKILTQKEVLVQTLNADLATLRTSMKEMNKRSAAAEDSATQLKNSLHDRIADLNLKVEKSTETISKLEFAKGVLNEKVSSLETKLVLARAELETEKRKQLIHSNASSESMELMREKNMNLQRSLHHEHEKNVEIAVELSKYKDETARLVQELQDEKESLKLAKEMYSEKHAADLNIISGLNMQIHETTATVSSKDALIEKLRSQFIQKEQTVSNLVLQESKLQEKKEEEIQNLLKEERKKYYKLLDRLKLVQKQLGETTARAAELEDAIGRANNHPAHRATELHRAAAIQLSDAMALAEDSGTRETELSELWSKYQQIIDFTKTGSGDLSMLSGNAYVGLAKVSSLKKQWLMGIRNIERALQIWRESGKKEKEYDSLRLAAGYYVHAFVESRNVNLLDRALDKLRSLISAANFSGKEDWKHDIDVFKKIVDDIQQVKSEAKDCEFHKNSTGDLHFVKFFLVD